MQVVRFEPSVACLLGIDLRVVSPVCEDNIHVGLLKPFQRGFEPLDNVLPREAFGVWLFATSTEEDLRNENVLVLNTSANRWQGGVVLAYSWPGKLLEGLSHLDLALAIGVHLRSVKRVNLILDPWISLFSYQPPRIRRLTPFSQAACKHSFTMFPFWVPP